jgi:hypothetical protein
MRFFLRTMPTDALEAGLTGEQLRARIKGHILGVRSVVRRYQR